MTAVRTRSDAVNVSAVAAARLATLGPLYVITGNTAALPADDVAGTFATVELFEANVHASYAGERARLAVDNTVLQLSAGPASDVDSTLVWRETGGAVAESPWGPLYAITGYDPAAVPAGDTVVGSPHATVAAFEAAVPPVVGVRARLVGYSTSSLVTRLVVETLHDGSPEWVEWEAD